MKQRRGKLHCYDFARPAVTVDIVLFAWHSAALRVLLIQRKAPPFAGSWALPGGYIDMREHLKSSAVRELREETGINCMRLTQLGAFGDPDRDPRGRTVTVIYYALLPCDTHEQPRANDDAADVRWWDIRRL